MKKFMPYGYIYETTNLINGKKYIGQRQYGKKEPYLGSGKLIKRAIKKYGRENFQKIILCDCETKEELNLREIKFISEVDAVHSNMYYNISPGGIGSSTLGYKHTEEFKKKMSERRIGKFNPFYGKIHTAKTKKQMSIDRAGYKHTEETKRKMSKIQMGRTHSIETKEKLRQIRITQCYKILCPDGTVVETLSLHQFCKLHPTINRTNLRGTFVGRSAHSAGFKILEINKI